MVRLSKKEQQDKRELLSSINQMNIAESKNVDNGECCVSISIEITNKTNGLYNSDNFILILLILTTAISEITIVL